jgi:hypothetical protein
MTIKTWIRRFWSLCNGWYCSEHKYRGKDTVTLQTIIRWDPTWPPVTTSPVYANVNTAHLSDKSLHTHCYTALVALQQSFQQTVLYIYIVCQQSHFHFPFPSSSFQQTVLYIYMACRQSRFYFPFPSSSFHHHSCFTATDGKMTPISSLFPAQFLVDLLISLSHSWLSDLVLGHPMRLFPSNFICLLRMVRARGSVVVKALCYKPEGLGFETRWGECLNLPNPSSRSRPWGLLSL